MREIKFRAWDGEKMIEVGVFRGRIICEYDHPFRDSKILGSAFAPTHALEQFTGLKDRNGVEIYEGDVLLAVEKDSGGATLRLRGVVEYIPSIESYICGNGTSSAFSFMATSENNTLQNVEVIGNIHENPDLLK